MNININAERLIEEVKARPAIWDISFDDYGDKHKRKRNWEDIVDVFIEDWATEEEKKQMGELLQKKWKNLRDRYSKLMQEKKRKVREPKKEIPYAHAEQMSFLDVQIKNRQTSAGDDEPKKDGKKNEDSLAGLPRKKKRLLDPVEAKIIQALDNNAIRWEKKNKLEQDDDRMFLLSVLPAMKLVPQNLKFAARTEVMNCINKYTVFGANGENGSIAKMDDNGTDKRNHLANDQSNNIAVETEFQEVKVKIESPDSRDSVALNFTKVEEMKHQFYTKLTTLIAKKTANNCFLTQEKYLEIRNEVLELKSKAKEKTPEDCQVLKRYDVLKTDHGERLIYPLSENGPIKYYVTIAELFDIIHDAHVSIGHRGRDRMLSQIKRKYKNVTAETIMVYLDICEGCQKKS